MVPTTATPAPTTTINTLGNKHPGKNGNSYCYDSGSKSAGSDMDWSNDYGQTCLDYELAEVCTVDGTFGPGWSFDYTWPELELPQSDGQSALDACCTCGGGTQVTYPPSPKPTSAPTKPPTLRPTREPTKETLGVDDEVTYENGHIRSFVDPLRDDDGIAADAGFNENGKQEQDELHLKDLDLWTLPDNSADVFAGAFDHLDTNQNGELNRAELMAEDSLTEATIDTGLFQTEDHAMDFAEFAAWRQEALLPSMLDPEVLPTPVTAYPTKRPSPAPSPPPTDLAVDSYGSIGGSIEGSYGIDASYAEVLDVVVPAPAPIVPAPTPALTPVVVDCAYNYEDGVCPSSIPQVSCGSKSDCYDAVSVVQHGGHPQCGGDFVDCYHGVCTTNTEVQGLPRGGDLCSSAGAIVTAGGDVVAAPAPAPAPAAAAAAAPAAPTEAPTEDNSNVIDPRFWPSNNRH
jgi:hypothetical protein